MDTTRISRLRKLEDDFNLVREVIDSLQDAVEGYDVLGMFNSLCDAVMAVALWRHLNVGQRLRRQLKGGINQLWRQ